MVHASPAATADLARNADVAGPQGRAARLWLGLAVTSLLLAGLGAIVPVFARVPLVAALFGETFAQRMLVVHVNLALVFWFYSFLMVMVHLLPGPPASNLRTHIAVTAAAMGLFGLFVALALAPQAMLSNYIPSLHHPVFYVAQGLFGLAVVMSLCSRRLVPWTNSTGPTNASPLPAMSITAIRTAAFIFLLAMATFTLAFVTMPAEYREPPWYPRTYFDSLVWGGGHILQAANVAALMGAWGILLTRLTGHEPVGRRLALVILMALALPQICGPVLAGFFGPGTGEYHTGFSTLMQWCIWPPVTVMLLASLKSLVRAYRKGNVATLYDPSFSGFATGAVMTVSGFILGAMIRPGESSVLVPAHYHASIGSVTVSFMAAIYVLLDWFKRPIPTQRLRRLATWQPVFFGIGQVTFVVGFTLAGLHNTARKTYGAAQHLETPLQSIGMTIMGAGGTLAIVGGVLFVWIVYRSFTAPRPEQTA